MQRVGILTYHTGYNYGASLQAFALQSFIRKLGYPCKIINFETRRFKASREMFSASPRRPKEWVKMGARLPYYRVLKRRQALFDQFTENCLDTTPLYRTEREVVEHATDFDCIICGSDQIWNLSKKDAPAANPVYFLNFPKQQRRVAYAASFGSWVREAPQREGEFLPWLRQFDAISVREESGAAYLRGKNLLCTVVIDPTLLLDAESYEQIRAPRQIEGQYVLLFSWSCGKEVLHVAKRTAAALGLPLYQITPPPRAMFQGIPRKLDAGPREFLSLIRYADWVVTDSFHGTAFSVTYEKDFFSVVSRNGSDTRIDSLLSRLGLKERMIRAEDLESWEHTDYEAARERKASLRKESTEFLKSALTASAFRTDDAH